MTQLGLVEGRALPLAGNGNEPGSTRFVDYKFPPGDGEETRFRIAENKFHSSRDFKMAARRLGIR